ncbi:glycosyl transferase [Luteimicrobium album]|uniref:Glycosyl transferase n=1 Tax=Luteimicrobium album TaxID=1054550 RepID=A0ABQ6I4G7_9MICO|nr:CDP-glycerol glycerophosphotransferase family protein [Luteimicrobium album]GMA25112.1 glycosyl transferase [Luteimicrobium album]
MNTGRLRVALAFAQQLGATGLVLNLLASAALVCSVAGAPTAPVVVLWCLTAVALVLLEWTRRGQVLRGRQGLGDFVVARLAAAASALVMSSRTGVESVLVVATSLVVAVVLCEPVLRRLAGRGNPIAANLPGAATTPDPMFGYGFTFLADTVAVVALCVTAAAGLSAVVPLVLSVAAALLLVVATGDALRRFVARRRTEHRLPDVLAAHAPTFALHWQAAAGTAYQVGMWLPYLERLGKPFVVVVRTGVNLREAAALTQAPVVLRSSPEDLDDAIVPSLKTVFYVNNAPRNSHMVRYPELTHIQLNHGDSDKAPSFNPVFRMFDKDFVAGQAAIDRFAANGVHVSPDLFTIVGRPQVEDVEIAKSPIADVERPTVLYAPTWAGFNVDSAYSSLGVGVELVRALVARGCDVAFRPHPYARRTPQFRNACARIIELLDAENTAGRGRHMFGTEAEQTMSVTDCFNRSDAMVSDVSSVVADFLYSEKPLAMVAVSADVDRFPDEFPLAKASYVIDAHAGTLRGLDGVLDAMLGADPMRDERRSLKTYYLGDIPAEGYAQRFLDEARAYV